jgi:hypothetical protein
LQFDISLATSVTAGIVKKAKFDYVFVFFMLAFVNINLNTKENIKLSVANNLHSQSDVITLRNVISKTTFIFDQKYLIVNIDCFRIQLLID